MKETENKQSVGEMIRESMGDVISPELAEKINEMFEEAVSSQVEARLKIAVENELDKMDESHAEQLEKLLEDIDTDHLAKTKKLMAAMDENYSCKLVAYAEKMQKELNENAKSFQTTLKESISQFLDNYLDDAIPMQTIEEAVQNTRSRKMVQKIKGIIGIDPSFVSESVKSAVMEAKAKMTKLEQTVAELTESKTTLEKQLGETSRKLMLEEKTSGFAPEKRDFIKRRLSDRTAEEIEANYDYVCEMFEADQRERRESLRESAEKKTRSVVNKIDKPREVVTEQKVEDQAPINDVSACLDILKSL